MAIPRPRVWADLTPGMLREHFIDWRASLRGAAIVPASVAWYSNPPGVLFQNPRVSDTRTLIDLTHPSLGRARRYELFCKMTDTAGYVHEIEPIEMTVQPGIRASAYTSPPFSGAVTAETPLLTFALQLLEPSEVAGLPVDAPLLTFTITFPSVALACQPAVNYEADVLSDGPVGYWVLDESGPAPTTAFDSSGNDNDGNILLGNGAWGFSSRGPFAINDCSLDWLNLDTGPSAKQVDVPSSALDFIGAPNQEFTFECWARPESGAVNIAVMEKTQFNPTNLWASLALPTSGGGFKIRFQLLAGASNPLVTTDDPFNDGAWHHIVAVRTLASGAYGVDEIRLYVDNVLEDSLAVSAGLDCANTRNFQLGQRDTGGSGANGYNGTIAHAAVYDYALPEARINSHYTVGTTNP